ncbi:MAG: PorP/SprF family type IX secretion system membrane protein [Chitinophagales bacterium]|nr:PorP/SprF family type IX secretion system membrane protein [Chitinophagales bacterium]
MKKILFVFSLFLSTVYIKAQDPHFSQIQYNPLYLNPTFAGQAKKDNRFVGLYRDQWRTLPVPYSTTFASYDRKLKEWESGWRIGGGISFLYDRAGDGLLSSFNPNLTLSLAKYFNSSKQAVTLGITSGITIKSLDYSKLSFDNQYVVGSGYNPNLPTGESFSNNNVSYPNFTVGLNFYTQIGEKSSLDIGGTASNLHEPNQNFLYFTESTLPARYGAYAKAILFVGQQKKWNLQPGVFYNRQNKFNNILANAIAEVSFKENDKGKAFGLGFGAGYRAQSNDAVIGYLTLLYDNLRIGASYDANISKLKPATNTFGAFELALNYEWGESKPKKKKCDTIRITQIEIVHDTIEITKVDTVEVEKESSVIIINDSTIIPCDKDIQKWNAQLSQILPVAAYFANDQPNPKSTAKTTYANYQALYIDYLQQRKTYEEQLGKLNATQLFEEVQQEYNKIGVLYNVIKEALKQGRTVRLDFLGFTSPLANSEYNLNLSKRRIQSVKNYLLTLEDGFLKQYVDNGHLHLQDLPFGETISEGTVSDKLSDPKQSIFSKEASLERKVEIKYVIIQ